MPRSFLLLCLVFAAIGCAGQVARAEQCRQSSSIDWSETLSADGAELYLLTRAAHCDAPVMLWLHGGPGGVERPLFRLYNSALEEAFVVAYWDQRGAGRSYDSDADPARLTVEQHLKDLNLVVDHLRNRLAKDKIILVGHSWGSALGLLYAKRHPQKVAAFVGVAQFVSGIEAQRGQYAFVESEARRRNDRKTLSELAEIGKPPYISASSVLRMQTLVDRMGGHFHTRPDFFLATLEGLVSGYAAPWEIPRYIEGNNVSLTAMTEALLALDLRREVPSVDVPVVFMLGRHDRQLDARLAATYFDQIRSPRKSLIWFEASAHNIPFEEPDRFNRTLIQSFN